jgi:hypothetical protein
VEYWVLAVTFGVSAAAIGLIARQSRVGFARRNYLVGVRTRATLRSDEVFRAANRAAAGPMRVAAWGAAVAAAAVVVCAVVGAPDFASTVVAGGGAAVVLGGVLAGVVKATRVARLLERRGAR